MRLTCRLRNPRALLSEPEIRRDNDEIAVLARH